MTKSESPEENLPSYSAALSTSHGKSSFSTPIRPILYHACSNDNNVSNDDGDGDVIFYKRYEDEDDGNNREFDSQTGSCSSCSLSVDTEGWRCVCVSPQLSELQLASHNSHSRALSDMRLESIEGSLDAHKQQLLEDRAGEEDANEQPQQDEDEDKEEAAEPQADQDNDDSPAARNNQLSVELIEMSGASSPLRRRRRKSSICCEPMVQYELIDSVCKSRQQLGLSRFARRPGQLNPEQQYQPLTASDNSFFGSHRSDYEDDDDVMNIRSPVTQRTSGEPTNHRQHQQDLTNKFGREPGWTAEQLFQYNEVLGFLQEACATRSPQISIPGARLAQMEQLLRSLHPKA